MNIGGAWRAGVSHDEMVQQADGQVRGRSVYNPLYGGIYGRRGLSAGGHRASEVIADRRPRLWGANAVNGVTNHHPTSSSDTQAELVSGAVGRRRHGFGEFRYGGKAGENGTCTSYGKGSRAAHRFPSRATNAA